MRIVFILIISAFLYTGCRDIGKPILQEYRYQPPDYQQLSLSARPDTMQFGLDEDTYNELKSFNCFTDKGIHYMAFFDRRSATISIHYLYNQQLYKKISVRKLFNDRQLYKTTVFVQNWDSIFITNKYKLYLFDSSGHKKQSIAFLEEPKFAQGMFDSNKLPVVKDNQLFMMVRNNVDETSFKSIHKWKVLYAINLTPTKETVQLYCPLPATYQTQQYSYQFLDYNFCYNNKGKFVLSFPADTLLYETDLQAYYHAYFARSEQQQAPIAPITQQEVATKDIQKAYHLRDSYGSVFFDPYKKYYLRLARHKITAEAFQAGERKKETVLIFDEQFRIVGESTWPAGVDFDSLVFTPDGQIYARTNFRDERALHFVRFEYQDHK